MWLVTDASGHIGIMLIQRLPNRGENVRAWILSNGNRKALKDLDIEMVEGDILYMTSLFRAFNNVRGTLHPAAGISILSDRNTHSSRMNVEKIMNALRAVQETRGVKLTYTSTISVIRRVRDDVIDEPLPYNTYNPYGEYYHSKSMSAYEVQQSPKDGQHAVTVYPTGVIGSYYCPGFLTSEIIRAAAEHKPILYVHNTYDSLDVSEVAHDFFAASEKGRRGERCNLSGKWITVTHLPVVNPAITGGGFIHIKILFGLAQFAARLAALLYCLVRISHHFTLYFLEVLRGNDNFCHAKATFEMGCHTRLLVESLTDSIRWFLESKDQNSAKSQFVN